MVEDNEARRVRVNDEANALFDRIGNLVQEQVKAGAKHVDVVAVLHKAGLRISEGALDELGIPRQMIPHTFLPWNDWFPWKPLWSYFFSLHYPGSVAARAFIPERAVATAAIQPQRIAAGFNGVVAPMP